MEECFSGSKHLPLSQWQQNSGQISASCWEFKHIFYIKLYDFFVNANISIKQIIAINREYEPYPRINNILTVRHKYYN